MSDAHVGDAYVDILPSFDAFVAALEAGLHAAVQGVSAHVSVSATTSAASAQVAEAVARIDTAHATIKVGADTSSLTDLAGRQVLSNNAIDGAKLKFGVDDAEVATGLGKAQAAGEEFASEHFNAKAGFDVDPAGLAAAKVLGDAATRGGAGSVAPDPVADAAKASADSAKKAGEDIGKSVADGMDSALKHFVTGFVLGDVMGKVSPIQGAMGMIPWKDLLGVSKMHLGMTGLSAGLTVAGGAAGGGLVAGGALLRSGAGLATQGISAGLSAAGSLGVEAVGSLTDMAGTRQAKSAIQTVLPLQQALNVAVAQYGSYSTQARQAQLALNQAMLGFAPAARPAILAASQLASQTKSLFQRDTAQAVVQGAGLYSDAMRASQSFFPTIGADAARNIAAQRTALAPFFQWLDTQGLGIFQNLNDIFTAKIPTSIHAATQGFEVFAHVIQDAAQHTGTLTQRLDGFLTRMNSAQGLARISNDINSVMARSALDRQLRKSEGGESLGRFAQDRTMVNGQAYGGMAIWDNLNQLYTEHLRHSTRTVSQGLEILIRAFDIAANYTGTFTNKFGAFIDKWNSPAQEPALAKGVHSLIDQFHILTTFLSSVGGVVQAFFKFDPHTGDSIFQNLTGAANRLKGYLDSASGGAAITQMLQAHKQQTMDLLTNIENLIGAVGPGLIGLITTLSQVSGQLLNVLGPALQPVINTLVATLGPLLQQFVTDLSPILRILSDLLPPLITNLGSALRPVLDGLAAGLTTALPAVADALGQIVAALGPALGPVLAALGQGIAAVAGALGPILAQIIPPFGAFAAIVPTLAPTLPPLGAALANLVTALAPLVPTIAQIMAGGLVQLVTVFTQLLTSIQPLIPPFVAFVQQILAIPQVSNVLGLVAALGLLHAVLPSFVTDLLLLSKAKDAEKVPTLLGRILNPVIDLAKAPFVFVGEQIKNLASLAWDTLGKGLSLLWDGVTKLAQLAWSGITTGLKALYDGAVSLARVAWSAIADGAAALWGQMVRLAGLAWEAIASGAAALWGQMVRLAGLAWEALASGVVSVAGAVGRLAALAWESLVSGVASAAGALISFGRAAAAMALDGLVGVLGFLATGFLTLLTALIPATAGMIGFDVAADANPIGAVVIAVVALGAGLYELITHWDAVVKFLHGPWGTAISAAVIALSPMLGIAMLIVGHWGAVKGALGAVWDWIKGAAGSVAQFFTGTWWPGFQQMIRDFTGAWRNLVSDLGAVWDALRSAAGSIVGWFVGAWNAVVGFLSGLPSTLLAAGSAIIGGLWSGIQTVWNAVAGFFAGIPATVKGWFSGAETWLIEEGVKLIVGISTGVQRAWADVVGWFNGLRDTVGGWFTDAGTWLIDVGAELLHGLLEGAKRGLDDVTGWAQGAGKKVVDTFKEVFGIHSPSTVMADQVGAPIAQGIAQGITGASGAAVAAAKQVSDQISQSFGDLKTLQSDATAVQQLGALFQNLAGVFSNLQTVAAGADATSSAVGSVVRAISTLAGSFVSIEEPMKAIIAMFGSMSGATGGAVGSGQGPTMAIQQLAAAFQALGGVFDGLSGAAAKGADVAANVQQVESAVTALASNLQSVVQPMQAVISLFGSLSGATGGAVGSGNGPTATLKLMGDLFANLSGVFDGMAAAAGKAGAVATSVTAIQTAVSSLAGTMPQLDDSIQSIIDAFGKMTGATGGAVGSGQGPVAALKTLNDMVSQLASTLGNMGTLTTGAAAFNSAFGVMKDGAPTNAMKGLTTALSDMVVVVGSAVTGLQSLAESLTGIDLSSFTKTLSAVQSLFQGLGSFLSNIGGVTTAAAAFNSAFGVMATTGPAAGAPTKAMSSLATAMSGLQGVVTQTTSALTTMQQGLASIDLGKQTKLLADLDNAMKGVDTLFTDISKTSKDAAGVTPTNMKAVTDAIATVGTAMSSLPSTISGQSATVLTAFTHFGQGVLDYFSKTLDPALTYSGDDMIYAVTLGVEQSVPAAVTKLTDIGKQMQAGLAAGIGQNVSIAVSAAQGAADAVTGGVKGSMKIASPSRVFHEIGGHLMQGMANGIREGMAAHVAPALGEVADGVGAGLRSSMGTLAGAGVSVQAQAPIVLQPNYSTVVHAPQGADPSAVLGMVHDALSDHDAQLLQLIHANRLGGVKG